MGDTGGPTVLLVICLIGALALGFLIREEVIEHSPNVEATVMIQTAIAEMVTKTAMAREINSIHATETMLAIPRTPTPIPTATAQAPAVNAGIPGDELSLPPGPTGGRNEAQDGTNLQWIGFLVLLFIPCYLAYAFGRQRIHSAEARKIKEKRRMMELEASIRMQMLRIQHEGRRRADHDSNTRQQATMEDDPCS
jgi:hypothetical protein